MRNFFLVVFFLGFSQTALSSPGVGTRYKVVVELENSETYGGYIYLASIMGAPPYISANESFINYFKQTHIPDTLSFYTRISTYKLNNYTDLDFTSPQYKKVFSKKEVLAMRLIEILEYPVGGRLKELTDSEYDNLHLNKVNVASAYSEEFSENCSLLLISEIDQALLNDRKNKLQKGLAEALKKPIKNGNGSYETNRYLDSQKIELSKENILLLSYCDAL